MKLNRELVILMRLSPWICKNVLINQRLILVLKVPYNWILKSPHSRTQITIVLPYLENGREENCSKHCSSDKLSWKPLVFPTHDQLEPEGCLSYYQIIWNVRSQIHLKLCQYVSALYQHSSNGSWRRKANLFEMSLIKFVFLSGGAQIHLKLPIQHIWRL